jgi:hypothetical protein
MLPMTSVGILRIVDVIGATVTEFKTPKEREDG